VIEAGGVELNEFHVSDPAPGPPCHGDSVAGRSVRIGRIDVNLAGTARGQDGMARPNGFDATGAFVENIDTKTAQFGAIQLAANDQVDTDVLLEDRDVRVLPDLFGQGFLDGSPGRVGRMNDATMTMAAFAREVVAGGRGFVAGERDPAIDEPLNGAGTVFDDKPGGLRVAQSGAGIEGVRDMGLDTVRRIEYGRDAALRPCACAVGQHAFRDQSDLFVIGKAQGQRLSSKAAAKNDDVEGVHCREG